MIVNFLLDERKGGPHFVLNSVKKKLINFKKKDIYLDSQKNNFFNLKKISKLIYFIDILLNTFIINFRFKKYNFFFIYGVYNLAPVLAGIFSKKKIFWFILENPNFLGKIVIKIINYLFNINFIFISKKMALNLKIKNYQVFVPSINLNFWKVYKINTSKNFTMTCVGNLNKVKNHIQLLKFLKKVNFKFTLNIVGQKLLTQINYFNKLKNEINLFNKNSNSKIILHGKKNKFQIKKILNKTHIFILPSTTEGLSISLLEAMSMKRICLVSKDSNSSKIINRNNGFIFELNDKSFLKKIYKIKKLNNKKITVISRLARKKVERLIKNYNDLFIVK
jgi:hypothetical protein